MGGGIHQEGEGREGWAGGWEVGIPVVELKNTKFPFRVFIDIAPRFKIS